MQLLLMLSVIFLFFVKTTESHIFLFAAECNQEQQQRQRSQLLWFFFKKPKLKIYHKNMKSCSTKSQVLIHIFDDLHQLHIIQKYSHKQIFKKWLLSCLLIFLLIYKRNREMNIVVKSLSKKTNLQEFLLALLDDVENYFKGAAPLPEDKTYATILTIFNRISRDFPLISSIHNLSKRIIRNIKEQIADKYDKSNKEKKKGYGLKQFMQGIKTEENDIQRTFSGQNQQNINIWIKKILLEGINELKEDIKQADISTEELICSKLQRIAIGSKQTPSIIFIDSFLSNYNIISKLKGYNIKKIVFGQPEIGKNELSIKDASRHLKKSRLFIISADAVLRNGGILSKNGSLMLAVNAHELGIPVVVITRSYCLWENIIINQESLVLQQSNKGILPQENETNFRVLIGKKYDYIQPKLISSLIGDIRGWESQNIVQIFQSYYE